MTKNYSRTDHVTGYAKLDIAPEKWLKEYVVDKLTSEIDTIVDFGCASGRNFIPFKESIDYFYGFDIHPEEEVFWLPATQTLYMSEKLEYYTCSIEDFLTEYNKYNHINWGRSLVMYHGALLNLESHEQQNETIDLILKLGCKNIVINDYIKDIQIRKAVLNDKGIGWLSLSEKNKKLFLPPSGLIKNLRSEDQNEPLQAHIALDIQ
jgi:hypothetical protein